MEKEQIFSNRYIRIAVYSDSKRVSELVRNFFDFSKAPSQSIPEISVRVYLEDLGLSSGTDPSALKYQRLEEDRILLSTMDRRIVEVKTDLRNGTICSKIFGYHESVKEQILDFAVMEPLRMIFASRGMFYIHGSMVARAGRSLIISGPQGAGKTTLALVLARNGLNLLTDDDCYIKIAGGNVRAYPFPTKMGLGDGILKTYPDITRRAIRGYSYGGKKRISLTAVAKPDIASHYECNTLIFPRYESNRKISLRRIPRGKAVKILTGERLSIYPAKEASDMVWTFYAFAKKADSYELLYNDSQLDKIPSIVEGLL